MKRIYWYFVKFMLCIILFLCLGILCKYSNVYKENIFNSLYQDYFDFSSFKRIYNNYLGDVFPDFNIYNGVIQPVFNQNNIYYEVEDYKDGAMVRVDYNYLVPSSVSGVVVYQGEKDGYGMSVIVEGNDGVDIWYGNLCNTMVKLYDEVEESSIIGEVCDNKLYLVYTRKNEFLDYNDYIN